MRNLNRSKHRLWHGIMAICVAFCLTCIPSALNISGSILGIQVTDIQHTSTGTDVEITLNNQTGQVICWGWVDSCQVAVVTTDGNYTKTMSTLNDRVQSGTHTVTVELYGCEGTVETVTITDLRMLNDNNLPEATVSNLVVYDHTVGESAVLIDFYHDIIETVSLGEDDATYALETEAEPTDEEPLTITTLPQEADSLAVEPSAFSQATDAIRETASQSQTMIGFISSFVTITVIVRILIVIVLIIVAIKVLRHSLSSSNGAKKNQQPTPTDKAQATSIPFTDNPLQEMELEEDITDVEPVDRPHQKD